MPPKGSKMASRYKRSTGDDGDDDDDGEAALMLASMGPPMLIMVFEIPQEDQASSSLSPPPCAHSHQWQCSGTLRFNVVSKSDTPSGSDGRRVAAQLPRATRVSEPTRNPRTTSALRTQNQLTQKAGRCLTRARSSGSRTSVTTSPRAFASSS